MQLAITHETRYRYNPPVQTAQHVAHLQPSNTPAQKVLHHQLNLEPHASVQHHIDAFFNHRADWALTQPHDGLVVRAYSEIETLPVPPAPPAKAGNRCESISVTGVASPAMCTAALCSAHTMRRCTKFF